MSKHSSITSELFLNKKYLTYKKNNHIDVILALTTIVFREH